MAFPIPKSSHNLPSLATDQANRTNANWNGKKICLAISCVLLIAITTVATLSLFGLIPLALALSAKIIAITLGTIGSGSCLYVLFKNKTKNLNRPPSLEEEVKLHSSTQPLQLESNNINPPSEEDVKLNSSTQTLQPKLSNINQSLEEEVKLHSSTQTLQPKLSNINQSLEEEVKLHSSTQTLQLESNNINPPSEEDVKLNSSTQPLQLESNNINPASKEDSLSLAFKDIFSCLEQESELKEKEKESIKETLLILNDIYTNDTESLKNSISKKSQIKEKDISTLLELIRNTLNLNKLELSKHPNLISKINNYFTLCILDLILTYFPRNKIEINNGPLKSIVANEFPILLASFRIHTILYPLIPEKNITISQITYEYEEICSNPEHPSTTYKNLCISLLDGLPKETSTYIQQILNLFNHTIQN